MMEELYNWFSNELPPLLQLLFGMFISLGVFKLITVIVDAYQKWKKSEE
ncbi:MAG: hypothetical protein OEM27_01980 [Nitrospinota bacterium]|nr:hypothetical protein [Nitrospinota bacterium]